jgi:hypothetical protein
MAQAASSGARTIDTIEYADPGEALSDLRNGRVNGVLTIPPEFSRRVLQKNQPRVALVADNTDTFVSVALASTVSAMLGASNQPATAARIPDRRRSTSSRSIRVLTCRICCLARSACRFS